MELKEDTTGCGSDRSVQDRLLDAAEELFCEKGFDGTSVRDLAAKAGCNIASVNYYFGGKEKLYLEVWRRHLAGMRDMRIASIHKAMSEAGGKPTLEDLLMSYANAFLEPLVNEGKGVRFIRLMAREMIDQHLPKSIFVEEMILPVMMALQKALMQICPGLKEEEARLTILSIVGQLMHAACAKTMFEQAGGPQVPKLDLNEMVSHIVKFSAAGIRAYIEAENSKLKTQNCGMV